jgi:GNAT superfamily N-acetyltransferase
MNTPIDFRQASPGDLPLVMEILAEAAAWLVVKGIDQWPSPPNIHWQRRMAAAIERGELYTAGFAEHRFAIVRLAWSDPYWPDDGRAGYVHTMAIRDEMHGRGIGAAILKWALAQVRRQGKSCLRLDCLAGNGCLRRYYEDQGFVYKGQISDRDYTAALYERIDPAAES